VFRSRWLEILETEDGDVRVDGIVLKGPDVAWTDEELRAQTYELAGRWRRGAARVTAENLGGNRFRVSAENVASFRILLAAPMGDLSRPFLIDAGSCGARTLFPEPCFGPGGYTASLTWKNPSRKNRQRKDLR
jgi:hypothetical protein